METWRQCAQWLVAARVLPGGHRASSSMGQVWDLAQALRDGVLLCHLLNALLPQAVPPRDICPRPQMSQFLCLRNIRTFLTACADKFGLPKHRLFGAFDLFDVLNFGKVIETLSTLSWTPIAQSKGLTPWPHSDAAEDDDDLYDCVEAEADDGDGVYEDLMRTEPPPKGGVDRRLCCLQELRMTEERYLESLEAICKVGWGRFWGAFRWVLGPFGSIRVHSGLVRPHWAPWGPCPCPRFLPYGRYCSQVEAATRRLEHLSCSTDLSMKLQECSQRANNGRFSLRDLLMVPMQRVLKYHLLLQELVKLSPDPGERERLRLGLDAMRDLAQCVNEVKRDNETLKQLTSIQLCLENMPQSLAQFGRPKIDGELKVSSTERRSRVERYGFLLDKALILCKRRGDSYEAKAVVDLQSHQVRDGGSGARDSKKWTHTFLLIEAGGLQAFELFFKTQELKKKWLEQFEMALSNIFPEHALADGHEFQMFSFEDTASCRACQMLLRGTFFQGYRCIRCRAPAHKECLGRVGTCGRGSNGESQWGYYGMGSSWMGWDHYRCIGIIMDGLGSSWMGWDHHGWGRNLATGALGWFPSAAVGPFLRVSWGSQFAGPMERGEAEQVLASRSHGSFLVRQRGKDAAEFAISIKYHGDVKHIKVMTSEGLYWVTEKKVFKGLVELVGFYQSCSLKEAFKALDTALVLPFKEAGSRDGAQAGGRDGGDGMEVMGWDGARARYAFSARDRTELTLREGDIVRVLSKRGHPGWWKGEVYGRVRPRPHSGPIAAPQQPHSSPTAAPWLPHSSPTAAP
uniref:Uncharacterized protein n=1 Tax=Melopsittacus undulatus TaxID=13146 RepID=A0A8V5H1R8_MELUD